MFKILSQQAFLIALVPDPEKEELAKMQISCERLCNLQDRRTIWTAPVTTLFRRDCSLAAKEGEAHSIARDSANSGRMAMGVSSYYSAASHFAPDKSGAQFRLLYEGDLVPA